MTEKSDLAFLVAGIVLASLQDESAEALRMLGLTLTTQVDGTGTVTGRLLLHDGLGLRLVIGIEDAPRRTEEP